MGSQPDDLAGFAGQAAAKARQLAATEMAAAGRAGPAGEDLPGLTAVRLADDLHALSAAALQASVERARAAGRTWQEIGDLLGVTRQAAFQRFGRPTDPRTGAPMNGAALPEAGKRATALLIDWIEARYAEVTAGFDAALTEQLTPDALAATWAQVVGTVGEYERMGEPLVRQVGDYTVTDIPLGFEAGEMKGRVAYSRDGKVSALFVLPPETL
jgi:Protein of unknown function (DUF3887)